jgi:hypothetical protein
MNPYKVLNVDCRVAKREIIQAAALALRERKFSGRDVALAQKQLLDPISRATHEFLHFIDVKPLLDKIDLCQQNEQKVADLDHLSVFDEIL